MVRIILEWSLPLAKLVAVGTNADAFGDSVIFVLAALCEKTLFVGFLAQSIDVQ